ncbi:MAG: hypothetical protein J6I45_02630 [Clostridia bacterium]|nr:hypothetical protein [Clostridia bacterium]
MDNKNNNSFEYTYSAPQQEEIKRIREKYLPREADKMEQLRRLDQRTTEKARNFSLTCGIISVLLLGFGMSCVMVWSKILFIPGIIIGLLGISGVTMTYPLYQYITRREREKIAPEIIRLTDELMK